MVQGGEDAAQILPKPSCVCPDCRLRGVHILSIAITLIITMHKALTKSLRGRVFEVARSMWVITLPALKITRPVFKPCWYPRFVRMILPAVLP